MTHRFAAFHPHAAATALGAVLVLLLSLADPAAACKKHKKGHGDASHDGGHAEHDCVDCEHGHGEHGPGEHGPGEHGPGEHAHGEHAHGDHAHHGDHDRATHIAHRSAAAMGGEAWNDWPILTFSFFGARTHTWDRATGRHRFEGTSREGEEYVVVQDLDTREGTVWVNGEAVSGDDEAEWLERAYGAWINDTYWLLMPMKLTDHGVHLTDEGTEEIDGETYDKLKITFEQVGLTPGDTYWAWFDQETGLMHQWAFHLQGWEAEREPSVWRWLEWRDYGPLTLSSSRVRLEGGEPAEDGERRLDAIAISQHADDAVFESLEGSLGGSAETSDG